MTLGSIGMIYSPTQGQSASTTPTLSDQHADCTDAANALAAVDAVAEAAPNTVDNSVPQTSQSSDPCPAPDSSDFDSLLSQAIVMNEGEASVITPNTDSIGPAENPDTIETNDGDNRASAGQPDTPAVDGQSPSKAEFESTSDEAHTAVSSADITKKATATQSKDCAARGTESTQQSTLHRTERPDNASDDQSGQVVKSETSISSTSEAPDADLTDRSGTTPAVEETDISHKESIKPMTRHGKSETPEHIISRATAVPDNSSQGTDGEPLSGEAGTGGSNHTASDNASQMTPGSQIDFAEHLQATEPMPQLSNADVRTQIALEPEPMSPPSDNMGTHIDAQARTETLQKLVARFDEHALELMSSSEKSLSVSLTPHNLGRVILSCRDNGGELAFELLTDTREARAYLAEHEDNIRDLVESTGYKLSQFDVKTQADDARDKALFDRRKTLDRRWKTSPSKEELSTVAPLHRSGSRTDGFWLVA